MVASIIISVFSLVLFIYWFRYSCLLILSTRTTKDFSGHVIRTNQLSYRGIREMLDAGVPAGQLETINLSLDRDFELLTHLLCNSAALRTGRYSLEQRMLVIDYHLMRVWYSLSRSLPFLSAGHALREMSEVVGYFANALGEHSGAPA